MKLSRFLIEGATLVIAAVVIGLVANVIAGSERKISLAAPDEPERRAPASTRPEVTAEPSIIEDDQPDLPEGEAPAETATSPTQATPPRKASKETILERFPASPDIPAEEIHTEEAKWLWDQGTLFLDARRTAAYNDGHIPRAKSVAVWEADVDDKVKELAEQGLDPDMPIVIYCSGGECEDSHLLAQKLWGMFFNNLRVYHEGLPGWKEAGYPVEQS